MGYCFWNISILLICLQTDKFVAKFILWITLNILTKHFQIEKIKKSYKLNINNWFSLFVLETAKLVQF